MEKGQTYIQKSWDQVGCALSDGAVLICDDQESHHVYYGQLREGRSWIVLVESLGRTAVSGCSHWGRGNGSCWSPHIQSAFTLRAEKGFDIPLNPTWYRGQLCHSPRPGQQPTFPPISSSLYTITQGSLPIAHHCFGGPLTLLLLTPSGF